MPTYEYECQTCGHKFEQKQAISEVPVTECPKCHGVVRRIVSGGTGFILKENGQTRHGAGKSGCSFEQGGKTCCGRDQRDDRCGTPHCGE
ncbi:MAG: zinc ribbon domain-containing protein [bacterium]